jgi:hypothetical protein
MLALKTFQGFIYEIPGDTDVSMSPPGTKTLSLLSRVRLDTMQFVGNFFMTSKMRGIRVFDEAEVIVLLRAVLQQTAAL